MRISGRALIPLLAILPTACGEQLAPYDGPPPEIVTLVLASDTAAVDGGFVPYAVAIANPGPGSSGWALHGMVRQGALLFPVGDLAIDCGAGLGVLPRGDCQAAAKLTMSTTNGAAPVPGSAVFIVYLRDGNGDYADSAAADILIHVGPTPTIIALDPATDTAVVDGDFVPYTVAIANPGPKSFGWSLQGMIRQGALSLPSGGGVIDCGAGFGVLRGGDCLTEGGFRVLTAAGTTPVPGAAVLIVYLRNGNGDQVDSAAVDILLVGQATVRVGPYGRSGTTRQGPAKQMFTQQAGPRGELAELRTTDATR